MDKETINLPLYGLHDYYHPIVRGSFLAKNGQMLEGFYMIDTGAAENMLNKEVVRLLGSETATDETCKVSAVDNKGEVCSIVNICVGLDEHRSNERFCISQSVNFTDHFGKVRIIGLLGANFLTKHQLVVDLKEECLKTATINPVSPEGKSFFFPMEFGMHYYQTPVVGFVNGDDEYVCIADTGCDISVIADGAMKGIGNFEKLEGRGNVTGVAGTVDIHYAKVSFSLLSITVGEPRLVDKQDIFQVLPDHEYVADYKDGKRPPISALLGAKFMIEQKWILDFGNQVIYAT